MIQGEISLDIFKLDKEFETNEAMYEEIRKEIIGDAGETTDEEVEAESGDEAQQAPGNFLNKNKMQLNLSS